MRRICDHVIHEHWTASRNTIALFSAALLLGACGQQSEAERVSLACGDDAHSAYQMTKRFVAGSLGDPETVEFPYLSEVRTRKPDPDNPCAWLIYGYVDVKAPQKGIEQRPYVMNITYSGENQWRATDFRWQTLGDSQAAETGQ